MFKKALQRVQKIASNSPAEQSRPLRGMGAAMRSGSGLMPVASQSGSGLTPVASQSGSAMGITPPPGGAGLASMSTQQMQGILKGTPVGYSGPIPQSRAMTDSETAAHTAAFDKMRADAAARPKMGSFFGNVPFAKAQQSPTGMKKGGKVKVSSASKRADGIAVKGKTRGKMV